MSVPKQEHRKQNYCFITRKQISVPKRCFSHALQLLALYCFWSATVITEDCLERCGSLTQCKERSVLLGSLQCGQNSCGGSSMEDKLLKEVSVAECLSILFPRCKQLARTGERRHVVHV